MKVKGHILGILIISLIEANAFMVHDVVHTGETIKMIKDNAKFYTETAMRWKENYGLIHHQINHLNDIKGSIGDPKAFARKIGWDLMNDHEITAFHEQEYLFYKLKESANGLASLGFTEGGIFDPIKSHDADGNAIERDTNAYKKHDLLEKQYEAFEEVNEATAERKRDLQKEALKTMDALKNATTESEIQLLSSKINAINGQFDLLQNMREDEIHKLQAQEIINRNQKEKEARAAREEFIHEQRCFDEGLSKYFNSLTLRQKF